MGVDLGLGPSQIITGNDLLTPRSTCVYTLLPDIPGSISVACQLERITFCPSLAFSEALITSTSMGQRGTSGHSDSSVPLTIHTHLRPPPLTVPHHCNSLLLGSLVLVIPQTSHTASTELTLVLYPLLLYKLKHIKA